MLRKTANTVCQNGGGGLFLTNSNKAPFKPTKKERQTVTILEFMRGMRDRQSQS